MPRSPSVIVLAPVDKQYALPRGYRPRDLVSYARADKPLRVRRLIVPDLDALLDGCGAVGGEPLVVSAYRSQAYQARLFATYITREVRQGLSATAAEERANTYAARPGHSEHHLGTTVDISVASLAYELDQSFGALPAGRWLHDNAHLFGFVLSYPAGKHNLTGYIYEPWHLRWIGRDLAGQLYRAGYLDPATAVTPAAWLRSVVMGRERPGAARPMLMTDGIG